jgi:hypothetical protein
MRPYPKSLTRARRRLPCGADSGLFGDVLEGTVLRFLRHTMTTTTPTDSGSGSRPGKPWRLRLLLLLLMSSACVAAYYAGTTFALNQQRADPTSAPVSIRPLEELHIAPGSLALGELWEEPSRTIVLKVENRGSREVHVVDFAASCDCTNIEPRLFSLGPGQFQAIRVTLNLTHRLPYQHGLESRPLSVRLTPAVKGAKSPSPSWEITAAIRSRISFANQLLHFDDKCVQYGPPASRKIRATAHVPIRALELVAEPTIAALRVEQRGHSQDYDVIVTPSSSIPIGPFQFQIRTLAVLPDGSRRECAAIKVFGEMLPPARIIPAVLLLGEHPVGATAKADVTIKLPSAPGWVIDHVEVDGDDTRLASQAKADDGTIHYNLVQHIVSLGDQTRYVRFAVRSPEGKTESSVMKVIYFGEVPVPAAAKKGS